MQSTSIADGVRVAFDRPDERPEEMLLPAI